MKFKYYDLLNLFIFICNYDKVFNIYYYKFIISKKILATSYRITPYAITNAEGVRNLRPHI